MYCGKTGQREWDLPVHPACVNSSWTDIATKLLLNFIWLQTYFCSRRDPVNSEHTCSVSHLRTAARSLRQDPRAKQGAIQTNSVGAATIIEIIIRPSTSMTYSWTLLYATLGGIWMRKKIWNYFKTTQGRRIPLHFREWLQQVFRSMQCCVSTYSFSPRTVLPAEFFCLM